MENLNEIEKERLSDMIRSMYEEQIAECVKHIPSRFLWEELQRREKEAVLKLDRITTALRSE